ncbi:proline- glutamic acid- and leucine-rich protein 1-like [Panicum miliaceum]|uniref:Proline-glutamic acid-and leucine-rich protein 1-like n=1 Tax=Panicum miliaceum TaxID=4540 RepID=A0A3L6TIF3_PANMI|nr:proline- glutamic acid- and leucine-rich protein 1-like [Panicum miliaceum]
MRFQQEQSRKEAWEREEETRRREHNMERVMREQSRKIDQIEVELKHAQDINDVSQTTSAIYPDTVEAKVNRLETERVGHMDEIFSLRLAMQEMQAHMQGYDEGNPPPTPFVEQAPPPPTENPPPVLVVAAENVGEAGMDPELAAPPAPKIDLYAPENLDGFDMEVEENLGGVQFLGLMLMLTDLILKDMALQMKTLRLLMIVKKKKNLQKMKEGLVWTACLLYPPQLLQ